jgi:hypothetical protein
VDQHFAAKIVTGTRGLISTTEEHIYLNDWRDEELHALPPCGCPAAATTFRSSKCHVN